MNRLVEDIALLQRAFDMAGLVIEPGKPNTSFPDGVVTITPDTLTDVAAQLEAVRTAPREYRLIDDEAVWLLQAAARLSLHRQDNNEVKVARCVWLISGLREAVEVDLASAHKSIGR